MRRRNHTEICDVQTDIERGIASVRYKKGRQGAERKRERQIHAEISRDMVAMEEMDDGNGNFDAWKVNASVKSGSESSRKKSTLANRKNLPYREKRREQGCHCREVRSEEKPRDR